MKFWKDPFVYWLVVISISSLMLGYAICLWSLMPMLENRGKDMIPQSDVQELINQSYRFGKQTARDDCRRVRDKEEQNETQ